LKRGMEIKRDGCKFEYATTYTQPSTNCKKQQVQN
jgi:hypothetical protein